MSQTLPPSIRLTSSSWKVFNRLYPHQTQNLKIYFNSAKSWWNNCSRLPPKSRTLSKPGREHSLKHLSEICFKIARIPISLPRLRNSPQSFWQIKSILQITKNTPMSKLFALWNQLFKTKMSVLILKSNLNFKSTLLLLCLRVKLLLKNIACQPKYLKVSILFNINSYFTDEHYATTKIPTQSETVPTSTAPTALSKVNSSLFNSAVSFINFAMA